MEETIECVNSIKDNVDYNFYSIVIIDNNSSNNSGKQLEEKFKSNKNIYVLLNENNIGFAKGNNIGYLFAKEKLNADFVACINNDTIVEDPQFIKKITNLYDSKKFHVMGPDIITIDGKHQNPYKLKGISLEEINDYIRNYKKNLLKSLLKVRLRRINLWRKLLKKVRKSPPEDFNRLHSAVSEDIVLHGSALIYSPLYIKDEENAFHPGTFMFGEEHILYHNCRLKGYKIVYSPITSIFHKEDASTDKALKSDSNKLKFIYKNELDSYLILKDILESEKNKR